MDMFDEAMAMSGTLELCKITQKELGNRMGVSQSYIANKLRLLTLSEHTRGLIRRNSLSERHARALLRIRDEGDRLEVLEKVISRGLTVRECEALVEMKVSDNAPAAISEASASERISTFVDTLRQSIGALRSLGVDVTDRTSYYGKKMYITLSIQSD